MTLRRLTMAEGAFSPLMGAPQAFDERGHDVVSGRTWLETQLQAVLVGWEVYPEPPEQLVSGRCAVIAPRDPYQSWESYNVASMHLAVHLLVPRGRGPSMDTLDSALDTLRTELAGMQDVYINPTTRVATLDDVGETSYVVATLEVDLTGGQLT